MTLENYGLTFHHLGLAVRDIPDALKVLRGLGYECADEIHDPLQEVRLVWCQHVAMPAVELVAPTDKPGPVDNILEHSSESIYHSCYQSPSIEESVAAIKKDGIRVLPVVAPKPAVLFGGRLVGFYQLKGFGLIEIVEES
jgi:methylmalonyl-CoA/ethylmalonyl-CoA epimerase